MRLGGILYSEGAQRSADRGERRCWRSKKQRVGRRGITQQAAAFAPLGPHRIRAGRARRRRGSVPVRIPRAEAAVTGRHHEVCSSISSQFYDSDEHPGVGLSLCIMGQTRNICQMGTIAFKQRVTTKTRVGKLVEQKAKCFTVTK
ncbi:uncharacterized protein LOC144984512 isoform X3 [Oryzias latipes]